MKIVSIDVGIKNCSFCILDYVKKDYITYPTMLHWDIVNLIDNTSSFEEYQKEMKKQSGSCDTDTNTDPVQAQYPCMYVNSSNAGTKGKCKGCMKPATYRTKQKVQSQSLEHSAKNGDACFAWQTYCTFHAKKFTAFTASKDLKQSALKKCTSTKLKELIKKYQVPVNEMINYKKDDMKELLNQYLSLHEFTFIHPPKTANVPAPNVALQIIGRNIVSFFDYLLGNEVAELTHILIENQIGPLATKMKTIQGMLMQYFLMRNENVKVEFISACNKLKNKIAEELWDVDNTDLNTGAVSGSGSVSGAGAGAGAGANIKKSAKKSDKKTDNNNNNNNNDVDECGNDTNISKLTKMEKKEYTKRKKQGVASCADILSATPTLSSWSPYFQRCKKKDDLADCFLQGVWYIQNTSHHS